MPCTDSSRGAPGGRGADELLHADHKHQREQPPPNRLGGTGRRPGPDRHHAVPRQDGSGRDVRGDLDTDPDAIRGWGASAVVTLVTEEEIDHLGVRDIPQAVRDRHMEWWHAPIPDGMPQLAGALYGLSGIPERWLERLVWRDRLLAAGRRLVAASPAEREEGGG